MIVTNMYLGTDPVFLWNFQGQRIWVIIAIVFAFAAAALNCFTKKWWRHTAGISLGWISMSLLLILITRVFVINFSGWFILTFCLQLLGSFLGWFRAKRDINRMTLELTAWIGACLVGLAVLTIMNGHNYSNLWWHTLIAVLLIVLMFVLFAGFQLRSWKSSGSSWCVHKHSGYSSHTREVIVEVEVC